MPAGHELPDEQVVHDGPPGGLIYLPDGQIIQILSDEIVAALRYLPGSQVGLVTG